VSIYRVSFKYPGQDWHVFEKGSFEEAIHLLEFFCKALAGR